MISLKISIRGREFESQNVFDCRNWFGQTVNKNNVLAMMLKVESAHTNDKTKCSKIGGGEVKVLRIGPIS